jgi:uncharacterized Zn finger protein (UPF0148 family)
METCNQCGNPVERGRICGKCGYDNWSGTTSDERKSAAKSKKAVQSKRAADSERAAKRAKAMMSQAEWRLANYRSRKWLYSTLREKVFMALAWIIFLAVIAIVGDYWQNYYGKYYFGWWKYHFG